MWRETLILTKRSLLVTLRKPFSFIPNLIISVFFLLVYTSGLSGISSLPQFGGVDYLNHPAGLNRLRCRRRSRGSGAGTRQRY